MRFPHPTDHEYIHRNGKIPSDCTTPREVLFWGAVVWA